MKYYFAPLEGITGHIFRTTYDEYFGGIDCYYTPFLTTREGGIMKVKEKRDILPENNKGLKLVPQLMTKNADEFIRATGYISELGYDEVNLNLGCPSKTVIPKGKGAAFLRDTDALDCFLYEIYDKSDISISIKSRIGFYDIDEFAKLLDIFNRYPVKLLTLHLRTGIEGYSGSVHTDVFGFATKHSLNPLCYNGDVTDADGVIDIMKAFPSTECIMIGRGYLYHPGFIGNTGVKSDYKNTETIMAFSDTLCERYAKTLYGENPVLYKMKEIWSYLSQSVPDGDKVFKKLKKANHIAQFKDILIKSVYP